jgi:hypothetical protein
MPDVGEDSDFARVEDGNDKRLAARQMQDFMTTTPCVEQVDLKALIEDGRAGDEILDAMIDQMNQTTARAEAAIDEAVAAIDASNQRIENLELKAKGKET